jgi:hypothetical protein
MPAAQHNEPREYDPFDDAMTDEPSRFYGLLDVHAFTCVLIKGQGKVPYDAALHNGQRTSTAIEFTITPCDATKKLITREMLNWTRDFKGVVRPSIETLVEQIASVKGLTVGQFNPLREIGGMWVGGEFVPRPDNKPGETWTTLKFDAVYADEAACFEAAEVEPSGELPIDPPGQAGADPERAAMAQFLPALWTQAAGDNDKFYELIASNPMLSKHFNADSPEVNEVIAPF